MSMYKLQSYALIMLPGSVKMVYVKMNNLMYQSNFLYMYKRNIKFNLLVNFLKLLYHCMESQFVCKDIYVAS